LIRGKFSTKIFLYLIRGYIICPL